ncbi:MAG: hypothetical protein IPG81_23375 [Sandaracinaceae bacterium]|nr:hypothetical protein [Sandaracinaceae bacterium]
MTASGVASRTCAVAGGVAAWTPVGASLSCSIVSCGAPPAGTNSAVAFTTTNFNDTAMYSATTGLHGRSEHHHLSGERQLEWRRRQLHPRQLRRGTGGERQWHRQRQRHHLQLDAHLQL